LVPPPATRRHRGRELRSRAPCSRTLRGQESAHLPASGEEKRKVGGKACKDRGLPPFACRLTLVPPSRAKWGIENFTWVGFAVPAVFYAMAANELRIVLRTLARVRGDAPVRVLFASASRTTSVVSPMNGGRRRCAATRARPDASPQAHRPPNRRIPRRQGPTRTRQPSRFPPTGVRGPRSTRRADGQLRASGVPDGFPHLPTGCHARSLPPQLARERRTWACRTMLAAVAKRQLKRPSSASIPWTPVLSARPWPTWIGRATGKKAQDPRWARLEMAGRPPVTSTSVGCSIGSAR
jgi:hypothetical protein